MSVGGYAKGKVDKTPTEEERNQVKKNLADEGVKFMPVQAPGVGLMSKMYIDVDTLCMEVMCYDMNTQAKAQMKTYEGQVKLYSDKDLAMRVSLIDSTAIKDCGKYNIYLKFRYIDDKNEQPIVDVVLTPSRVSEVWKLIKKNVYGEPTFLEEVKQAIEDTDYPVPMEDGRTIIDTAYIKGNEVFYIYRVRDKFEEKEIDPTYTRNYWVWGLSSSWREEIRKKLRKEGLKFNYIYNGVENNELFRFTLTVDDLQEPPEHHH